MKDALKIGFAAALFTLAGSAVTAQEAAAPTPQRRDISLGVIQRSIKVGMSSTEVFDAAGSPNLVTRGSDGRETWVYDRFSTESAEHAISAGGGGMGAGSSLLGALGVNGSKAKKTTSQKTLMVVVKFTADGMVEAFTYRSSQY